jgi:hypothetical protein
MVQFMRSRCVPYANAISLQIVGPDFVMQSGAMVWSLQTKIQSGNGGTVGGNIGDSGNEENAAGKKCNDFWLYEYNFATGFTSGLA